MRARPALSVLPRRAAALNVGISGCGAEDPADLASAPAAPAAVSPVAASPAAATQAASLAEQKTAQAQAPEELKPAGPAASGLCSSIPECKVEPNCIFCVVIRVSEIDACICLDR